MPDETSQLDTGAANEARMSDVEKGLNAQATEARWMRFIMSSIVVVTVFAFLAMTLTVFSIIQQYLGSQTATYQSLVDKVAEQSSKIDLLNLQCNFANSRPAISPQPVK